MDRPPPRREPPPSDPDEGLRHDLRTQLTVIRGHAQMLARCVARDHCQERTRMLANLAAIEQATRALAERIDRIDRR